MEKSTDFGYSRVDWTEKTKLVKEVFSSVANKYDLMNDLMSFGLHRLWKKFTVQYCKPRTGDYILDLAGGTGDLSLRFAKAVGDSGQISLVDINNAMLQVAKQKLINHGILHNVHYIQADAEQLPLPSNYFDCIAIAFGLRNVRDKALALEQMYRVLKPGGQLVILEFSHPSHPTVKSLYDAYSFVALPLLGKIVANDKNSYQYLVESIRMHPDQETLLTMLSQAQFENCRYENLFYGVCAIHSGFKY